MATATAPTSAVSVALELIRWPASLLFSRAQGTGTSISLVKTILKLAFASASKIAHVMSEF